MISICIHSLRRQTHIVEHALQLLSKLGATFYLQFRKHATFCVVRYRTAEQKPLREMALVIAFEDISVS